MRVELKGQAFSMGIDMICAKLNEINLKYGRMFRLVKVEFIELKTDIVFL